MKTTDKKMRSSDHAKKTSSITDGKTTTCHTENGSTTPPNDSILANHLGTYPKFVEIKLSSTSHTCFFFSKNGMQETQTHILNQWMKIPTMTTMRRCSRWNVAILLTKNLIIYYCLQMKNLMRNLPLLSKMSFPP